MQVNKFCPFDEQHNGCRWPFRQHAYYQKVYAPLGVFGPQYDFSNLGEEVDLSGLPIIFWSGKLYKSAAFLRGFLVGLGVERKPVIAISVGDYLYLLLPVTARVPCVERRLPFWQALQIASRESDIRLLWLVNLFMVGIAGTIMSCNTGMERWIFASLFALVAILLSRMIVWHETPPRMGARQAVRR